MIEKVAIPPTKNAIQNIARLLHNASESKKKMDEEKKKQEELLEKSRQIGLLNRAMYSRSVDLEPLRKSEPVSVPGVGTVDKVAIAQQIAAALVAQGRTNVSQEELETLINAVVGMAEASKNSDKPVTTADFVKGLTGNTTNANSNSNTTSNNDVLSLKDLKDSYRIKTPEPEKPIDHAAKMETLSDSDLKALLQNFKDLSTDEQHGLINFLKKLEATDSARVEKLRAYVNLGPAPSSPALRPISPASDQGEPPRNFRRSASPFSSRKGNHNPCDDEEKWKPKLDIFADEDEEKRRKLDDKSKTKLDLSDDDDDYTFEDIYKAADKNVNENEKAKKRSFSRSKSKSPKAWSRSRSRSPPFKKSDYSKSNDPNVILNETKRLIANIMGDLPTKYVSKSHLSPLSETSQISQSGSLLPSVSASSTIPSSFGQNYGLNSQSNSSQLPYTSNQYQTFPPPSQPQSQSYGGNSGFLNNGYNNFNQGFSNLNSQSQFSAMPANPYPPPSQTNYGGSAFGSAPSARPSTSYPPQQFGNYPPPQQQQRFY